MPSRTVEMWDVPIPLSAIARLSEEQRFTYYLLGHMFNELNCLQKMIGFAMPKHDDRRLARLRPELAQVFFLFRIACSKMWEGKLSLDAKEVGMTLRDFIFPQMEKGPERWKELQAAINAAPWLKAMRNGMGFHFPKFQEWRTFTTPTESWVDDHMYLCETTGNTFYDAADTITQVWMLGQYDLKNSDPEAVVDPLVIEMIDLLRLMNSFLEDVLGVFIGEIILKGKGERALSGKVLAPDFAHASLPFWTSDKPKAQKR